MRPISAGGSRGARGDGGVGDKASESNNIFTRQHKRQEEG